jgi:hypothetical protein
MTKNDRAIIDAIKQFAHSEGLEIEDVMDRNVTVETFFDFSSSAVSRWMKEEISKCDGNKIGFDQLSHFQKYVQSTKFKKNTREKDLLRKFASHLLVKQFEILTGQSVEKHLRAVNELKFVTKATLSMCQSAFISVTSLENLHEIIATLFNPKSDTKAINLSLNQELLLDAINIIESYAYSDGGNFSDVLTIKLFVPTYTVFADIMAGMIEGELVGFIENEDSVFVEMSDIGKSLVGCEIETQLHQKPAWDELPKSPELRVLKKLQRDGIDVSDIVIDIVTTRYETTVPYIKGNVFERLSEIDADLTTDFVKFANDNALASQS